MAIEPLDTAHGGDYVGCCQLSVFLENRLGQLLRLTRVFDGHEVSILGLSVESGVDCAIVRMLVDDADTAHQVLTDAGFAVSTCEMLVVELPAGKRGIMTIAHALIAGEVNINYVYPLINAAEGPARLAIHVDNLTLAADTLLKQRFRLLDQDEL